MGLQQNLAKQGSIGVELHVISVTQRGSFTCKLQNLKAMYQKIVPLTPQIVNHLYVPTGRAEFNQSMHAFQCLESTEIWRYSALSYGV